MADNIYESLTDEKIAGGILADDPQPETGFWDATKAAFQTQNVLGSIVSSEMYDPQQPSTYINSLIDGKKDKLGSFIDKAQSEGYDGYLGDFYSATNESEYNAVKSKIDRTKGLEDKLENAGDWTRTFVTLSAGVLDPIDVTALLPMGKAFKALRGASKIGNVAKGIGLGATAGAVSGYSSEAILQQVQPTPENEKQERLNYALAGGAILGGGLGGAFGALHKAFPSEMPILEERLGKEVFDLDDAMTGQDIKGSASAMATPKQSLEELGLNLERPQARILNKFFDKNQPLIKMPENEIGQKAVKFASFFIEPPRKLVINITDNPVLQNLNSLSRSAREAMTKLASVPYQLAGTKKGYNVATAIEDVKKLSYGINAKLNDELQNAWIRQEFGRERKRGDVLREQTKTFVSNAMGKAEAKMSLREFEHKVSLAILNGGIDDELPEVTKVAQSYRKELNKFKDEYVKYGFMNKGVENYLPGMPDVNQISLRPREFVDFMANKFAESDAEKLGLQEKLEPIHEKYKELKKLVKDNVKKIKGRSETRDKTLVKYKELQSFIKNNILNRKDSGFGRLKQAQEHYEKIQDTLSLNEKEISSLNEKLSDAEKTEINRINDTLMNFFRGQKNKALEEKEFKQKFNKLKNLPEEFKPSVKYPILYFFKGNIDPDGGFAKELRTLDVTPKKFPGYFKKGGYKEVDNIPISEFPMLADAKDIPREQGYYEPNDFFDAIQDELLGNPILEGKDLERFNDYQDSLNLKAELENEGIDINSSPEEAYSLYQNAQTRNESLGALENDADIDFEEASQMQDDIALYDRAMELLPSVKNDLEKAREIISKKKFSDKAGIDKNLSEMQKSIAEFEASSKAYGRKLKKAKETLALKEEGAKGIQAERDFIGNRGMERLSFLFNQYAERARKIVSLDNEIKNAELDLKAKQKELDDIAEAWGGKSTDEYKYYKAKKEREGADSKITDNQILDLLETSVQKMRKSNKVRAFTEYVADAEEFKDRLIRNGGRQPYWQDISMENIGGMDRAFIERGGGTGTGNEPGFLKARSVLNFVPQKELLEAGFYRSDISNIMSGYTQRSTAFLELNKAFGDADLTVPIKEILDDFNDLEQKLYEKRQKALEGDLSQKKIRSIENKYNQELETIRNDRKRTLRNMQVTRDRLLGVDGIPQDPTNGWYRFAKALRNYQYITKIGGSTASALPDMGVLALLGSGNVTRETSKLVKNVKNGIAVKKLKELQYGGVLSELSANTSELAFNDLLEPTVSTTKAERGLEIAAQNFAKINLNAYWNNALKFIVSGVTEARISDLVNDIASGKAIDADDATWLRQNNLYDDANLIAEQIKRHGETENDMTFMNWDKWDNEEVSKKMRSAMVKEVDHIVLTPGLQRSVSLNSSEFAKLLMQFKSFFILSSTQRLITLAQADLGKMSTAVTLMTTLGMMSYVLKQTLAGREISDDPKTWIAEGVDRAGYFGIFGEASNIADKTFRGGLRSLIGAEQSSRYQPRSGADAILGPSIGSFVNLFTLMNAVGTGEFTQGDMNIIKGSIPGLNLPYVQPFANPAFEAEKR